MKKARIAGFLKEYWGVQRGGDRGNQYVEAKGQNVPLAKVAETIHENERTTKRLLKLNDLIPELQILVSDGKLGGRGNKRENLMQTSAQGLNNVIVERDAESA